MNKSIKKKIIVTDGGDWYIRICETENGNLMKQLSGYNDGKVWSLKIIVDNK